MNEFYVQFNGVRLDDYLTVLQGFNRGIGTERTNNSVKVATKRGRVYLDHTYDQGVITMPFMLRYELITKRRELAKLLNVSEPAPLIFGDEPDKVYYAIPTGDIAVDEIAFLGKGTITWEIPDGVAYAFNEKVVTTADSSLVLLNEGTEYAYPIFDIKTKGDNGLIALVSPEGIVQYGNPNEVDGVIIQKSTRPLTDEFDQLNGWALNPSGFNSHVNGTVTGKYVTDGTLKVSDYGTGSAWHGPLIKKDIAGMPTNFSFQTWVAFKYQDVNRFGMIRLGVWAEVGKLIAEVSLIKNQSNHFVLPIVRVGNTTQGYSDHVADNFKDFYGLLQIDKFQDVVSFKLQKQGERYAFLKSFNAATSNQKVKSITIWMSQFGKTLPADLGVALTDVWAHNANVWEDVPNKFSRSDRITLNHETGKIYKNNLLDMLDADYGNRYFGIPPGETEVRVLVSDFAELDKMTVRYRERYV